MVGKICAAVAVVEEASIRADPPLPQASARSTAGLRLQRADTAALRAAGMERAATDGTIDGTTDAMIDERTRRGSAVGRHRG